MMSEIVQLPPTTEIKEKTKNPTLEKNPKRVSAGKKGAEAKKMKAELKRKEVEAMKKENMKLKSITKDDDKVTHAFDDKVTHEVKEVQQQRPQPPYIDIYKNYIPLCLILVVGLGLYMYKSKQVAPVAQKPTQQKLRYDKKKSIHSSLGNFLMQEILYNVKFKNVPYKNDNTN